MRFARLESSLHVITVLGLMLGNLTNVSFGQSKPVSDIKNVPTKNSGDEKLEVATLGAGCFWCVEAVYQRVNGVKSVVSGYAGGTVDNPTYKQVSSGLTGHAEVCQITFDPEIISYEEILEVFWKSHDPTTLNKQGNDEGTQYRSVIFYSDDRQRDLAEEYKEKQIKEKVFARKVVTEISPLPEFFPAEDYHQNYFNLHKNQSYCQLVIAPKVGKFEKVFKDKSKLHAENEAKKNAKK